MPNIFDTLVKNNAFLSHKKFNPHEEHSIRFVLEVNSKITLHNEIRTTIKHQLMWIDLEDNETKKIMPAILDKNGKPTGIDYDYVSDKDLYHYNFGEKVPNYNNRSVRNYAYSSFKNIYFCHVKKHTGVDLALGSDCQPNAKCMRPCYPNDYKLKPNLLSGVKDCHNKKINNDTLHRRKCKSGETCILEYNEPVLNKKKLRISNQHKKVLGNDNKQFESLLSTNINTDRGYNTQEVSSCNNQTMKN